MIVAPWSASTSLLLAVLVVCALSLVTSRHQARKLFVELEREQARRARYETEYGQLQLEQSTWAMPARVEKIARDAAADAAAAAGRASRSCRPEARDESRALAATLRNAAPRAAAAALSRAARVRRPARCCSRRCSGARSTCSGSTTSSCRSRAARATAARSRCRRTAAASSTASASALAISTPVKSLWAFPGQVDATPRAARALAHALDTPPHALDEEARRRRRLRLSREAGAARERPTRDRGAQASRASTTRTSTGATIPAARR